MVSKTKISILFFTAAFLLIFLSVVIIFFSEKKTKFEFASTSDYWPTKEWKTSTPEEQGMDSRALSGLFDEIKQKSWFKKIQHKLFAKITKERTRDFLYIKGLLVIRNGYIVLEANTIYDKSFLHPSHSSTKSFSSAIFGIALNQGIIKNTDEKVLGYFPDLELENIDAKKAAMTIKHLLTMSSGLQWPEGDTKYSNLENPVRQMKRTDNWVQFVLNQPAICEPGQRFNYNSGCTHVLTAILHKKTQKDLITFAQNNLFTPLGITHYLWKTSPKGILVGGGGLSMPLRDMGKFGYLYLKGGVWDGRQIIAKNWVEESTKRHMKIGPPVGRFIP
ncbi:MAG: serine hydrolase, partial [Desulfobacteraceae bacterium]|nr:serine hydrolase [Desulfobacteraceae bacterium]